MLFSLLYLVLRRVLGTGYRPQDERDIELLVLRHQVRILKRQIKRPRLRRLDRVLLAAASRTMQQEPVVLVRGEARDPAPLAPRAGRHEVDIQEERSSRPATGRSRGPGPHRPPGEGEPVGCRNSGRDAVLVDEAAQTRPTGERPWPSGHPPMLTGPPSASEGQARDGVWPGCSGRRRSEGRVQGVLGRG